MYMGFGVSGSSSSTRMLGADATIAWVDIDDGPQAVDYHLSGLTQVIMHAYIKMPHMFISVLLILPV